MIPIRQLDSPTKTPVETKLRPNCGYAADHPLLETEIELESSMRSRGVAKFRERLNASVLHGEGHHTPGALSGIRQSIVKFSEAITEWREQQANKGRGRPHVAYRYLQQVDPDVAAAITLRSCFASVCREVVYTTAATNIGEKIEDDVRFKAFEEYTLPDTGIPGKRYMSAVQDRLDDQSAHYDYRRAVLSAVTGKQGFQWEPWPFDARTKVGAVLLDLLEQSTGMVQRIKVYPSNKPRKNWAYGITLSKETLEFLDEYHARFELLWPEYLPMVVQPKDWHSPYGGGYISNALRPLPLVKTRNKQYLEELRYQNLDTVYDAINRLQRTAWRTNSRILEVARWAWDTNQAIANLPRKDDIEIPAKPADIAECEESRQRWKTAAHEAHTCNRQTRSQRAQVAAKLAIAADFEEYDRYYFPYQLDFRGRIYPVPSLCPNPQGDDLSRSLITFADGRRIGDDDDAIQWFLIHGANVAGIDKCTFEARMQWVEDHHDQIMAAADDPYENLWWSDESEIDKPWSFLSWAFEYAEWYRDPDNFTSRIPVAMDGSCSGVQMFALMLRDPEAARAVNVLPTTEPEDMYQVVADAIVPMVDSIIESPPDDEESYDYAVKWRSVRWDRKTVKRACMTLAYGVTAYSVRDFTREWYKEAVKKGKVIDVFGPEPRDVQRACNWFGDLVWKAITEVNVSACRAMRWLQEYTAVVADENLPINWTTPSGFVVQQSYPSTQIRQVAVAVTNERIRLNVAKENYDTLDRGRQITGIAPNYVHSYDAALLTRSVSRAASEGIRSFAMIHDSFGTHAADAARLGRIVREQAAEIFAGNALDDFASEAGSVVQDQTKLPAPPEQGPMDPAVVCDSLYFIA